MAQLLVALIRGLLFLILPAQILRIKNHVDITSAANHRYM